MFLLLFLNGCLQVINTNALASMWHMTIFSTEMEPFKNHHCNLDMGKFKDIVRCISKT